ncbi:MAG: hypothetical protein QXR85_01800 [Candidatus Micrarchaeaceae archaeon]
MHDRPLSYAFYALALASFILSIILHSALVLVVVSVLLLMSSVYAGASKFVNIAVLELLHRANGKLNNVGYALAPGGAAATAKHGENYMSISAIRIGIGAHTLGSKIGEVLSGLNVNIDYVVRIRQIDSHRFVEGLAFKRRLKELELAKLNSKSYIRLNELRHEIEVLDSEISAVSSSRPVDVLFVVKVFSYGASPNLASKESVSNAQGIADALGTTAGAFAELLKGDELLEVLSC